MSRSRLTWRPRSLRLPTSCPLYRSRHPPVAYFFHAAPLALQSPQYHGLSRNYSAMPGMPLIVFALTTRSGNKGGRSGPAITATFVGGGRGLDPIGRELGLASGSRTGGGRRPRVARRESAPKGSGRPLPGHAVGLRHDHPELRRVAQGIRRRREPRARRSSTVAREVDACRLSRPGFSVRISHAPLDRPSTRLNAEHKKARQHCGESAADSWCTAVGATGDESPRYSHFRPPTVHTVLHRE